VIKKLVQILVAASAFVLMGAAVSVATGVVTAFKYDLESQKFADSAIVSICSRWDENALIARGSADFVRQLRAEGAARSAFRGFTVLGQMREFGGAFGHARIVRTDDGGPIVIAKYSSRDRFENGDAQITLAMVRADRGWKILRFSVTPVVTTASGTTNAGALPAVAPQS
jgi:hypothetical protein